MENNVKICQSCGMPLDKDPNKGGTNSDGSKNIVVFVFKTENL